MALAPEYMAVLEQFEKRLGEFETKDLEQMSVSLSRRGVFTSPYGVKPETELREKYAGIKAEKVSEMNLGEYLRGLQRSQFLEDRQRDRAWQLEDMKRQEEFAREIAAMYQPKKQEWWEPIVGAATTGLGYALGGPLGGAAASGITGLFSPKEKGGYPPIATGKLATPGYEDALSRYKSRNWWED